MLIKREYADRKMGWLSYSWGHSTRRGADGQSFTFGGDQPHTLTAVWSQPMPGSWRRWEVGVKFQVHSGRLYTPVVGRTAWCQDVQGVCTDQNTDESDPNFWFWRPQFAAINSKRLPWFYMVHLRLDRPVRYNTWRMNYYLDLQNVTMAQNVFGYDYGENYENYANPKKATGIPFMIPFFGVEASF